MRKPVPLRAVGIVFLAAFFCVWGPGRPDPAGSQRVKRNNDGPVVTVPREVPDDPPGRAARPRLGAAPAAPVTFASYFTYQVNVDGYGANIPGDAANEPSIAVDPTYPNRMAIGWRQFDTVLSNFRQAGYGYSVDNGRSWAFPGVLDPGVFRSDPVLEADAAGHFFYNSLKVTGGVYSCQVFKSGDGGISWSPPVEAYGGDKAWMTIDRSGGIGDGHIYSSWSTAAGCCEDSIFNRSTDGGLSFSYPMTILATPIWGTLAVSSDGTLYVGGMFPDNYSIIAVARSVNAKDAYSAPVFDNVSFLSLGTIRIGGGSYTPNPGGLLGQVWIDVDRSPGATAGNVYVLCSAKQGTVDPMNVYFSRSTDDGETWSTPVKVNDDPDAIGSWQWFGTMSVAPNGRIDAVWNDTRHSGSYRISELYYAYSTDAGVTWSANQQISPAFDSHVGWPNQNKIGDYYDMISDDVGAHLAWAATFNGEQDVYYTRIGDHDCNANGVGDSIDVAMGTSPDVNVNGIPDECEGLATGTAEITGAPRSFELLQNVPNPFNPATVIGFELPSGGARVELCVFNVEGRLVKRLVDGYIPGGTRSVTWDGRDETGSGVSSGLYFYRLVAPGFTKTRKMILLK